jgi:hypothetical protein
VLVAGTRAAAALGLRPDYFAAQALGGRPAYVVPHPSGVNRWWNDPANRAAARRFFEGVADEFALGGVAGEQIGLL